MKRRQIELALEIGFPTLVILVLGAWTTLNPTFYFPAFTDVLGTFRENWLFAKVGSELLPSLRRLAIGYCMAMVIGIGAGMILGNSEWWRRCTNPMVDFLRAIPPVALIPFWILLLGIGDEMKIAVIAVGGTWSILLNTIDGVRSVDPTLLATTRVYGLPKRARIWRVTIPAATPQIFVGLRTSMSICIILMIVSELVASTNGLGYFVLLSQRSFAIEEMWSGILILGLLGYVLNFTLVAIERKVLRWHLESHGTTT